VIEGVKIKKLNAIPDDRGRVMEILRSDDDIFQKFGQAYITTAYPGVIKAWHYHKIQADYFCCVHGMMKVVLFDDRDNSATRGETNQFFMGEHNPMVLMIPPGIYHGFTCVGDHEAIVINIPTEPYNRQKPDEYRLPYNVPTIPYDWERKHG
jgi:dTDP-4-dehydrorhamnose 3,5-epimerase